MTESGNSLFEDSAEFSATELLKELYASSHSPEQYLSKLLEIACFVGGSDNGAILRVNEGSDKLDVLALHPKPEGKGIDVEWLGQSGEFIRECSLNGENSYIRLEESSAVAARESGNYVLVIDMKDIGIAGAVGAFMVRARSDARIQERLSKFEVLLRLLHVRTSEASAMGQPANITMLQKAIDTLSSVNKQKRFKSSVMAFCNEAASQWCCERVSMGFLNGRYVELKAMSHTEEFSRKMKLVIDIESSMEECLDQDIEILYPAEDGATYICRAAEQLSKHYGPEVILNVPLRHDGEVIGAVTFERPADKKFSLDEVEAIRLACEMCTSKIASLREYDRWFGARAASKTRDILAEAIGPKHTWGKVLTFLIFCFIVFLVFAKGTFKVKAPFVIEATYRQVVPAPFDGYIKNVESEIGQLVVGNETVLASLDTSELRLRLAASKAEKHGHLKQAAAAMRDGETAQNQIAQANAAKADAEIELLSYVISQAELISPISGTILLGDLKREVGAPVKTGDVLFEVAPLSSLRAEIMVPEDDIFEIELGQKGRLATVSYPAEKIDFVVERINPIAEVVGQRNVFKVRVRLVETHSWMRPGMEGVGKVYIEKRHYIWIWTRKITNWIRMKVWL
jgi:biotin carboxyl carrier protein/GAF domain-containing protein